MPISLLRNNLQLQFQSVVPLCILNIYFTVKYYMTEVVSTLFPKRLQDQENITMGNETQVNQEEGSGTGWRRTGYRYRNSSTTKESSFKSNIPKLNVPSSHKVAHMTPQNMMIIFKPSSNTSNENTLQASTLSINPRRESARFGDSNQTHKKQQLIICLV